MTVSPSGLLSPFHYGKGDQRIKPFPNMAGNQVTTLQVTGENAVKVVTAYAQLVTSATAGNRFPTLTYLDGDGVPFAYAISPSGVAASLTQTIGFVAGLGYAPNYSMIGVADIILYPGWSVQFAIANGLAADAVNNMRWLIQEFPTGPDGYSLRGRINEERELR